MKKDSVEFTGKNICEVIEFLYIHKEERQDVPFMKLLKEGCDVFVFWVEKGDTADMDNFKRNELRIEKGGELFIKIKSRDDEGRRVTDFKGIQFTGLNIVQIIRFIENNKNIISKEGLIYKHYETLKNNKMDLWWDCDNAMLYLNNLKDGKCTVEGLLGYSMLKGHSSDFIKSE